MTREEAIRRMECCRNFLVNNYSDMGEPNVTAFNMAIKALEIEPCEDAISRQATIEAFQMFRGYEANRTNAEWVDRIETIVKKLPPVNPQEPCDKCEVGNPCLYCKHEFESKTGHWIWCVGSHKCSNCEEYTCFSHKELLRYCPNCGAKMEDEE